jgi:hypothetical protein
VTPDRPPTYDLDLDFEVLSADEIRQRRQDRRRREQERLRRRRERQLVFWRRRITALAILFSPILLLMLVSGGGDDESQAGPSGSAAPGPPPLEASLNAARAAVERYEREAPGAVGVAVAPVAGGQPMTFGRLQQGHTWSAIKVPIAVAYLEWKKGNARTPNGTDALTTAERSNIEESLTVSSNTAARVLFSRLGSAAGGRLAAEQFLEGTFLRARGGTIDVAVPFGMTDWRLADALTFYRALARGCLLPRPDTDYLLELMRRNARHEPWGVAQAAGPGVPVASKGGWGIEPTGGYLVESVAMVGSGESAYMIASMARPGRTLDGRPTGDPQDLEAGRTMVRRLGELVQGQARAPRAAPTAPGGPCPRP